MPERAIHTVRYTADADAGDEARLALEPEYVDTREALADLADVDAMLAAVRAGASARGRQLDRCRWATILPDGIVRVTLRLYVWPSDLGLDYTLSGPEGARIGPAILEERPVSRRIWTGGATSLDLPWLLRDALVEWVPGLAFFDGASRETPAPAALYAPGARVAVRGRGYGLLQVSGTAQGFVHEITMDYDKADPDPRSLRPRINMITADDWDMTCLWRDRAGREHTETARMTVPACVKSLLASCSNGVNIFVNVHPAAPTAPVIYYSSCDGTVLAIRDEPATPGRTP